MRNNKSNYNSKQCSPKVVNKKLSTNIFVKSIGLILYMLLARNIMGLSRSMFAHHVAQLLLYGLRPIQFACLALDMAIQKLVSAILGCKGIF